MAKFVCTVCGYVHDDMILNFSIKSCIRNDINMVDSIHLQIYNTSAAPAKKVVMGLRFSIKARIKSVSYARDMLQIIYINLVIFAK